MKHQLLIALACAGLSVASADVLPSPPDNPVAEACKPLIGVWQRLTPQEGRRSKAWMLIAIDSTGATVLGFENEADIDIRAVSSRYKLDCAPAADGKMKLAFDPDGSGRPMSLEIVQQADGTFTTEEMTSYTGSGAPEPNWKPEPVTVTFKRIIP